MDERAADQANTNRQVTFAEAVTEHVFSQIGLFVSKTAVATFGGAYAVLAYVAREAVQTYQRLTPGEMLNGLGMAETTPGPLIIVTQFVGFMGAFRATTGLDPLTAAILCGALTTWVTFVPRLLWIFLGAPHGRLNAALGAISAAVVGVIMNLALWFGLHLLFARMVRVQAFGADLKLPVLSSLNLAGAGLAMAAALAAFRFKVAMIPLLLACSAAGVVLYLAAGLAPAAH